MTEGELDQEIAKLSNDQKGSIAGLSADWKSILMGDRHASSLKDWLVEETIDHLGPAATRFSYRLTPLGLEVQQRLDQIKAAQTRKLSITTEMRRLIIAARVVAYEDVSFESLKELDQASEAFAEDVPWDNEPEA